MLTIGLDRSEILMASFSKNTTRVVSRLERRSVASSLPASSYKQRLVTWRLLNQSTVGTDSEWIKLIEFQSLVGAPTLDELIEHAYFVLSRIDLPIGRIKIDGGCESSGLVNQHHNDEEAMDVYQRELAYQRALDEQCQSPKTIERTVMVMTSEIQFFKILASGTKDRQALQQARDDMIETTRGCKGRICSF
jgi:hypothetical protein